MIIFTVTAFAVLAIIVFASNFEIHGADKLKHDIEISSNRLEAGEKLHYEVEIQNVKFLVLPIINIIVSIPCSFSFEIDDKSIGKNNENDVFKTIKITTSLLSFQKVKQSFEVVCKKRGSYEVKTSASAQDLLGIRNISLFSGDSKVVLVHPQPINYMYLNIEANSIQGDELVRRWSNPDPIFYNVVREYSERDSLKDIEWKASAKMGNLVVKKYDTTSDESFMYLIMSHRSQRYDADYKDVLEQMFEAVEFMIEENEKNQIPYAVNSNLDLRPEPRNFQLPALGYGHLIEQWDLMAYAGLIPDLLPTTYLADKLDYLDRNCTIVFYYYSLEESDVMMINNLARHGHNVKVIIYKETQFHPLNSVETLMFKGGEFHA